jgi:hypothetical protein
MHPRSRAIGAGVAGTLAWAASEPFDKRVFRHDYSDLAVLGKAFTRGRGWLPLGLAVHALNGAVFGLAYYEIARRSQRDGKRLALELALLEHLALFSLGAVVDRHHPARGRPGLAKLFSIRAFGQATFRHTLFGLVLAELGDQP